MANIIGNLVPDDDYMHELGPEENFNESMYFNFFDTKRSIGGFMRLGNRANEGHAEMTTCLYLPEGRVVFAFKRAPIDNNDAFEAGGMHFEVIEPSQSLRTTYEGSAVSLADATQMADPRAAFKNNPKVRVALDVHHEAVGPMYGGARHKTEDDRPAEEQFASAHYEQHMHVTGSLDIDDEHFEIDGYGLRDHSWGPRYWQAIESYEWLTMNFGPEMGAMVSIVRRPGGEQSMGGVIIRGDEMERIVEADIAADYADNDLYHEKVRATVKTEKGETLEITGEVQGFIPLRNRRNNRTTHIGEGMTRWQVGDQTGYGLSEFLKTLD